ncbi:MAG: hypothetical protein IKQ17_13840 [Kiritimatiellae bacterium]|nr:hypothetical protein [Kiritimatiellia bacterium]
MDRPELEKKLRNDAWEAPLSAELREQFYFAIEPLDFPEGTALAAKEPYSLPVPSMAGYYRCQGRARAAIEKARLRASALAKLETAQAVAPLVRSAAVNAVGDGVMADTLASLAATAVMQGADKDTITALGSLACGFRANALKAAAQQTKDEQLKLAREKFEAAERRLERVAEIADAARGGKVDPAKVADEIDRILGRKK